MDLKNLRKKVNEISELRNSPPVDKNIPGSVELDAAKRGMGFMVLRQALTLSEKLMCAFGLDQEGLRDNCMEDDALMNAYDSYMSQNFHRVELSSGRMVLFCLAGQLMYTPAMNAAKRKKRSRVQFEETGKPSAEINDIDSVIDMLAEETDDDSDHEQ
jgi:hypothetical protein